VTCVFSCTVKQLTASWQAAGRRPLRPEPANPAGCTYRNSSPSAPSPAALWVLPVPAPAPARRLAEVPPLLQSPSLVPSAGLHLAMLLLRLLAHPPESLASSVTAPSAVGAAPFCGSPSSAPASSLNPKARVRSGSTTSTGGGAAAKELQGEPLPRCAADGGGVLRSVGGACLPAATQPSWQAERRER